MRSFFIFLLLIGLCYSNNAWGEECPDGGEFNEDYNMCLVPAKPAGNKYSFKLYVGGPWKLSKEEACAAAADNYYRGIWLAEVTRPTSSEYSWTQKEDKCTIVVSYEGIGNQNQPYSGTYPLTSSMMYTKSTLPSCPPEEQTEFTYGPINVDGTYYCGKPAEQPKICEGNPVSVSDGAKVHKEHIFTGPGQHPLRLDIDYNSKLRRWNSDLDLFLELPRMLLRMRGEQYAQFETAGTMELFGKLRQVWKRPGNQDLLIKEDGGYWQLMRENGRFELYNKNGYLVQVTFGVKPTEITMTDSVVSIVPSGITHFYTYVGGKVSTITHSNGSLVRYYWSGDKISSLIDTAGKAYNFAYTSNMLSQLTYPDYTYKLFYYTDSRHPGALTHIQYRGTPYAWYKYNEQGRVIESRHFEGTDKHSFDYTPDKTVVTNPLNKITTYHYADAASEKLSKKKIAANPEKFGFHPFFINKLVGISCNWNILTPIRVILKYYCFA